MRKQDIKPGVVYAYQRGKYASPSPVMFLSMDLYERRGRARGADKAGPPRWVTKAAPGAQAGDGIGGAATGYPVVRQAHLYRQNRPDPSEVARRIARFTLADFEASQVPEIDDHIEFDVIPRLAPIVSTWEEAAAMLAREAEELAGRRAAREASHRRADAVIAALVVAGIDAEPDQVFSETRAIVIPLDEAEKLARLLSPGTEGEQDHG